VRRNAADLCPLLADNPDVTFVLMHIGYPYQDAFIALAKHYRNVVVDLCWAWIINPAACVRFVKEFLLAAPASKLLTFGGDYATVENVVGHAAVARQGLAQALSELVAEGWLTEAQGLDLVEPLMRGNARALFPTFRQAVATGGST
jgi:predicted TIM-barrel fold metal-dependent hydrolase